jgi:hypothetical protein
MTVLEYREKSDEEKVQYKMIHAGYTSNWWKAVLAVLGVGTILTDLLCAHTAIEKPYDWTMNQNLLYFGLSRSTYCIGTFLIFFFFILGGWEIGK